MFLAKALIFFILKKNSNFRLYVNYQNLNAIIVKNRHFLLLIIKTLDRLYKVTIFIKIDLKNAYYKIHIAVGDKWKTTFKTRYNLFKYYIMFFRLVNVLATF